ncbi:E3 ubiquitin-protein ligase MBR1-like protein, partial [Drosera capensis]
NSSAARSISCGNGLPLQDTAPIDRVDYASCQILPPRLEGQFSTTSHVGVSRDHSKASESHSINQLPTRNVPEVLGNLGHQASSSTNAIESNLSHLPMGNVRGPYKRKFPGIAPVSGTGSTEVLYCVGSSSVSFSSAGSLQERSRVELNRIGEGEGFARNVRSRSIIELKSDSYGSNQLGDRPCSKNLTRSPRDLSISSNYPRQDQTVPSREPGPIVFPAVPSVRRIVPGVPEICKVSLAFWSFHPKVELLVKLVFDTGSSRDKMNQFVNGNSISNVSNISGQTMSYPHNLTTSRDPSFQSAAGSLAQRAIDAQTIYRQRVNLTRAADRNWIQRVGHVTPANPGVSLAAQIPSVTHTTPSSRGGHVGSGTARAGFSAQGNRQIAVNAVSRDQVIPEVPRAPARSSLNTSRNVSDLHRLIGQNIDRMSYEQLLALGERIGSVNTGVRADLFPKCLIDMIYYPSEPEEERCLICLEDYESMDLLAAIKTCNHDYHTDCIKKWLSIKNSCPICKVAALRDNEK